MDCKWKSGSMRECISKTDYKTVVWWLLLIMAVLVVPSMAISLIAILHANGGEQVALFVATCLLCVFLGMRLMKSDRFANIIFERVTLSEQLKQHTINMVSLVEAEAEKWKKRYEKCEPVFMSLSRQPAWDYLDEVVQVLVAIKRTVEVDATISFKDVKALSTWVESAKPNVLDGYLHTLEATYTYAKAEYLQQGKNIDEIYPELGKGHIATFVKPATYANAFAHELLATLKLEHPVLAQAEGIKKAEKIIG